MTNQLTREILEKYIPIVFATLIESFLVLLNRLLATIQPFNELHMGHSLGSRSIDLKYTSLPPQLLFWKAAKAKHLLLGILCLVTILGNALSVSLGALFNELPAVKNEAIEIPSVQTPTITKNSLDNLQRQVDASTNGYMDHYTISEVYWTTGTKLPPWLTEEYFFLPFDLDRMVDVSYQSYTAKSHGVTVAPSCKLLAPYALTRTTIDPPQFSAQPLHIGSVALDTLPWKECLNAKDIADPFGDKLGSIAKELYNPGDQCSRDYVHAWARSKITSNDTLIRNVEVTGVTCQPKFVTAEFDLTVDSTGRVLQASRISDFRPVGLGPGNGSHIRSLEDLAFGYIKADPIMYDPWRNGTITQSTLGHFLNLRNGSFAKSTTSLPDTSRLVSEVEAVMKMLTGALFQQNPSMFEKAVSSAPKTQATRQITVTKIFMADVAFIISMVLLSINVVTAIIVYVFGPAPFLPRFPDTIGSVLAYVAKSRLTEPDWEATSRRSSGEESEGAGNTPETTYSFGRYTDRDGNEHLGIDADPFVVKVDRRGAPEWQRQDIKTSWLTRFRGRSNSNIGSDVENES
ncbi:hypothetical protein PG999_010640 [Apiospora kogelbergensis]|uniref:Uncharacterized protein n=1 Tax=Apiospora kogelbergensis TaxID=1337665 RepID=A0AAW0QLI9_9PEZI